MIHPDAVRKLAVAMEQEIEACKFWAETEQTCLRKAVGVSIIRSGYNGTFDAVTRNHNGPSAQGHQCTNIVGNCGCSHAEPRAILNAIKRGYGWPDKLILLCTYSPCTNCANVINDSKIITAVVYKILTEHDVRGAELLVKAGLDVITVSDLQSGKQDDHIGQWR
jgi:deoxycytidylate deaminase